MLLNQQPPGLNLDTSDLGFCAHCSDVFVESKYSQKRLGNSPFLLEAIVQPLMMMKT